MATTGAIAPKNSSGSGSATMSGPCTGPDCLNSFEARASQFSIPPELCAELGRETIAPVGAGTVRMRRVCGSGSVENAEIVISCDDLSDAISFSMSPEKTEIPSACPGKKRSIVSDYTVTITLNLYLDRLLANPNLLGAVHQVSQAFATVDQGGQSYSAFGVGLQNLNQNLARFYVEFTPIEAADGNLAGTLFFPYAELSLLEGDLSFSKSDTRTVSLMLEASIPPVSAPGLPQLVYGIWTRN